jgi:cell division septation protein DedD
MKKLMILGCAFFFVFCMTKKATVKTEGLEEVVVFGEDTTKAPTAETVTPPTTTEETVNPPPVAETVTPPPVEEVASAPPITPPAASEESVAPAPPLTKVAVAPAPAPAPTPAPATALIPTPSETPASPQGSIYGFRIQIFASSTEKNAMKIVDDARSSFGGKVYVEHLAPYYKVRVGDCLTREDAQLLKTKAVGMGYRGAFIVETMINP